MLLAIDTSNSACSSALWDGELLASCEHVGEKGHAEMLVPQVEELLKLANCEINQVTKIIVTTGPGSFTGVRVAIAAARGFALVLNCPLFGITSFDAIASSVVNEDNRGQLALNVGDSFSTIIDARRGQVYLKSYMFNGFGIKPTAQNNGEAVNISEVNPSSNTMFFGGGAGLVEGLEQDKANEKFKHIFAKDFCQNIELFVDETSPPPTPLYLRAPDAEPAFSFLKQKA